MNVLWIAIIAALALSLYNIGKVIACYSWKASICGIFCCWIFLLAYIFLSSSPEYEFIILNSFANYIYLRGGIYLPAVTLFFGLTCRSLNPRSRKAIAAFIIFLSFAVIYDYRWVYGIIDYNRISSIKNKYGICFNSIPETNAAAAGSTIVYYYGVNVNEKWMAKATLTRSRKGTDIIGLLSGINLALEGSECRGRIERLNMEMLEEKKMPCLVFLKTAGNILTGDHSGQPMVCFGINERWVMLGSPRRGLTWMPVETFAGFWNSYAIIIDSPEYFKPGLKQPSWL
ncbi:MAG: cysteine peptidase family C39 domain-containing protein [Planctomycetota bacterium]